MQKKRKLAAPSAAALDELPENQHIEEEDEQQHLDPSVPQPFGEASEEIVAFKEEEPVVAGEEEEEDEAFPQAEDLRLQVEEGRDNGDQVDEGLDYEHIDLSSIQKLLDPFPKDQLIELLRDAASAHPDVLAKVYRLADADPTHRKIFVHGLGWDATTEALLVAFQEYGEIEDCKAVTDKATGKCKGYGFILFKHRNGACRALKEPQKKIGNRMTSCQLASIGPPGMPPGPPVSEYTQRKIYISNVGAELDPQKLLQFFAKYGEIEEGPLGLDKATGKPRGFCLFVYKDVESARKALEEPHKIFEGNVLHCQRAIDGPKQYKLGFNFQNSGLNHIPSTVPQPSHYARTETVKFIGGPGGGHLMAPSATGLMLNQAAAQPAAAASGLNPALGQALTAILAQGSGLGLTNILNPLGSSSGLGESVVSHGVQATMSSSSHGMQGGYANHLGKGVGGYGAQGPAPSGYGNAQLGQGPGRSGHMGGYMGH